MDKTPAPHAPRTPQGQAVAPDRFLQDFLAVIGDEARDNPGFRLRLLDALGACVVLTPDMALDAMEPLSFARRFGLEPLATHLHSLKLAELKKFAAAHHLASAAEIRAAKTAPLLAALATQTIQHRIEERGADPTDG